jgi:hypothetical protein
VRFSVQGTPAGNSASGAVTTNAGGTAMFCYQGPALGPSTDAISAYADSNGSTTQDTGEPSDTAQKDWVLSGTACKVTGSGSIVASNGDRATFDGSVKSSGGATSGQETYQDRGPAQQVIVRSTSISAVSCTAASASVFGRATINGSGTFLFRIDVQDNGEAGKGSDTYRIRLSNGYDSGQRVLTGGNVQVRLG